MNRTPAAFYMVTLGERMLFLGRCDRFTEADANAELAHFKSLFGAAVALERFELGEDMIVTEMAIAIHTISKDGTGCFPQHLEALGFSADHVARYFTRAHGLVARANARPRQPAITAPPSNVVAFPARR